jgi:hypothetical protein
MRITTPTARVSRDSQVGCAEAGTGDDVVAGVGPGFAPLLVHDVTSAQSASHAAVKPIFLAAVSIRPTPLY